MASSLGPLGIPAESESPRYKVVANLPYYITSAALRHLLESGGLTIQDFERLCPGTNRRTLQRDLKTMMQKGLIVPEGATNQLIYRLPGRK